jgi:hypothetical protein
MAGLSQIWIETWAPEGVVRADRVVGLHLRRGGNVRLPEPAPEDEPREMSFCAETASGDGPLLLGCTDDVATAPGQLAELADAVRRAAQEQVDGPLYVFRGEGRDGTPRWTVDTRLPAPVDEPLVPAPRATASRPIDIAGR